MHGFPPAFKFTNGRKMAANVEVDISSSNESHASAPPNQNEGGSLVPGLTKEQYVQLMSMLQHTLVSESPSSHTNLMASTNFAGPFTEESTGS